MALNILARRELRIGAGLVLILLPSAYLLARSAAPAEDSVRPGKPAPAAVAPAAVTEVLTATIDLRRGDVVTAERLGRMKILGAAPADALTDPRSAEFLVAVTDIPAGQIILRSALSAVPADAGLAVLVPAGKRAIALRVSDEIAVGNFLRPGDHADLVAVFGDRGGVISDAAARAPARQGEARIVLQDVAILTVGSVVSGAARDPGAPAAPTHKLADVREVTLAVSPEQAAQIALIRSVATYYLALRNYRDGAPVRDVRATLADLLGQPAPPAAAPAAAVKPRTVETLIGAKLERVEVRP